MDAIITENLYESFKRKFSVGQNRLGAFEASFLAAYNDVIMDMYNDDLLVSEPELLTTLSEDSEIKVRYLPQIKSGIRFFLQTAGEWVKGDDVDKYAGLTWERAKGVIANTLTKDDQNEGTYTGPWGETA